MKDRERPDNVPCDRCGLHRQVRANKKRMTNLCKDCSYQVVLDNAVLAWAC